MDKKKQLKKILDKYPMLEADRDFIVDLTNKQYRKCILINLADIKTFDIFIPFSNYDVTCKSVDGDKDINSFEEFKNCINSAATEDYDVNLSFNGIDLGIDVYFDFEPSLGYNTMGSIYKAISYSIVQNSNMIQFMLPTLGGKTVVVEIGTNTDDAFGYYLIDWSDRFFN